MSLLLCFFVLLLTFSEMDKQKFKQVAGSMEQAFGIQRKEHRYGSPEGNVIISTGFMSTPLAVKLQRSLEEMIAEEISTGAAEVEYGKGEMTVRVKDSLAFDLGRAEIKKKFYPFLDKLGRFIKGHDVKVQVRGHTDNVPLAKGAPFRSNWSLSAARAVGVVEYWKDRFGVSSKKVSAAAFADGSPLVANDTPAHRAKNRRVEFFFSFGKEGPDTEGLDAEVTAPAGKEIP
jgi:chemotaxis protein MotB